MKGNRSSDTAGLIARSIILASRDPVRSKLVSSGAVDRLTRVRGKDWFHRAAGCSLFRKACFAAERFLLPGILTHYLARKVHLEQEVENAIRAGCRRVVVVGAGYDTLAWRLQHTHPGIEFLEIDHPETQKQKRVQLTEHDRIILHAVDLRSHLPSSCLPNDGISTAFVVEGLTMYFNRERVKTLMIDLSRLAGKQGRVIWTFMEKQGNGSIEFQGQSSFVTRWLGLCGEPFRWGMTRNELADFSRRCGLKTQSLADHETLRREIPATRGLPLAKGELICTSTPVIP